MLNIRDFALQMISQNPQIANNPQAQSYIETIRNGSIEDLRRVATNICNSYGVTPEQAAGQAINFFGFRQ